MNLDPDRLSFPAVQSFHVPKIKLFRFGDDKREPKQEERPLGAAWVIGGEVWASGQDNEAEYDQIDGKVVCSQQKLDLRSVKKQLYFGPSFP